MRFKRRISPSSASEPGTGGAARRPVSVSRASAKRGSLSWHEAQPSTCRARASRSFVLKASAKRRAKLSSEGQKVTSVLRGAREERPMLAPIDPGYERTVAAHRGARTVDHRGGSY